MRHKRAGANDFMADEPETPAEQRPEPSEKNERARAEILRRWEQQYQEGRRRATVMRNPLAYLAPDSTIKGDVIYLPRRRRKGS